MIPFKVRLIFRGSKKELIIQINEVGASENFKTFKKFIDYLDTMVYRDKDFQFNSYTYAFKPKDVVAYELYAETEKELDELKAKFLDIEKRDADKLENLIKKTKDFSKKTKPELEIYGQF
jgi:hypothetical protein